MRNSGRQAMETNGQGRNRVSDHGGFTLLEILFALVIMAMVAVTVSAAYSTGTRALDGQVDLILLDSRLRSRMEMLVSTDFAALAGGTENVTVNGKDFTIDWTVAGVDLNGDGIDEPTARQVTVDVAGMPHHTLTTLVVDTEGQVGKI